MFTRDSGNLHHHIPAARRVQPPRLLITAGNSENPCPLPLLRCQTISALGARWGSALKVPTHTHPQNARTLVHDYWRAKSGNSENYCPRCHKNTRPLPPRVHWYRLECFPPAGLVFQPGNLNAAQATKGEMARIFAPLKLQWLPYYTLHSFTRPRLTQPSCPRGSGLAAIRLSPGMNRRPLLRHALPE